MATEDGLPRKLWTPTNVAATQMDRFRVSIEEATHQKLPTYNDLYNFSITRRSDFWTHLLRFAPIVYSGRIPSPAVDESVRMDSNPHWFPGLKLNFAQNILFTGDGAGNAVTSPGKEDDKIAVTEVREGCFDEPIREVSWKDLRVRVGRLSNAMRARGVRKGDRIALVASTCIDTLCVFLAAATLGALFSSSSTDMGTKGILDRLLQIRPKFLFFDDAAVYNGKRVDLRSKIKEVVEGLRDVKEFEGVVTQTRFEGKPLDVSGVPRTEDWNSFLASEKGRSELKFEQCEFNEPLLIVYSSGTTGQPKCIVHRVGGIVLNGHKEATLHREINSTSVQLQYTTTGWIMYTASVQALLPGARIITYDGSPFLPSLPTFIKLIGQQRVTHLGTSPKYLQTLQSNNIVPKNVTDLGALKVVTCTGMVLSTALFTWFYDVGFPTSVQFDNISGGTDLAGAFGTGNPVLPIYAGGCQCVSLGIPMKVYDSTIEPRADGKPVQGMEVPLGEPGDLVGTQAFPTMPLYFYGDPDGSKYFNSYFAKNEGVWTHGDFIQIHPVTGQVIFLGRADGVLNPGGVRFGSSEIYSVIEKHFAAEIADSICVGQRRPQDTDERVILFCLMQKGHKFNAALIRRVKEAIGLELSKRHIPKFVFETPEIPTTVNLKKVELPVKQIVSGKKVKASGTLGNPGSLDFYYQFAEDRNLVMLEQQEKARL